MKIYTIFHKDILGLKYLKRIRKFYKSVYNSEINKPLKSVQVTAFTTHQRGWNHQITKWYITIKKFISFVKGFFFCFNN